MCIYGKDLFDVSKINNLTDIKNKRFKFVFYKITILFCISALVVYSYYTLTEQARRQKINESYADILADKDSGHVKPVIIDSKGNSIDFNELREINPSIYGYIDIIGTDIQSPVEVNDFGRHTMLYTMSNNTDKFSERNVVIYVDNKRYPDIINFTNEDYIKVHLQVNISSLEKDMAYKIFAVGYGDNRNIMSSYNFGTFSGLMSYIDYVKSDSVYYDDSCNIDSKSGIITFSTDISDERLLILAVMVTQ